MKKTAFILLALVIMLFAITSVASAASSKSEYYSEIVGILDRIGAALGSGNIGAANSALLELQRSVAGLGKLLASTGEYNKYVQQITDYAGQAVADSVNWKTKLGYAYGAAKEACGAVTTNRLTGAPKHS